MAQMDFSSMSSTIRIAPRCAPSTVTHQDLENAVIDKGVNEGDKVVSVGAYVLQPGSRVTIDAAASSGS